MKNNNRTNKEYIAFADMKKKRVFVISLVVSLILLLGAPIAVLAAGNVSYEGHSSGFVFEPGSESSPTDLFPELKNIMPGDSYTDTVEIKNNSAEKKTAKIYMRALGATEGSKEFLSELELTVKADGEEIFNSTADQKAGLTDWVLLGEFKPGEAKTLTMNIHAPLEMGNEHQNAVGEFTWEFKVEEDSDPSVKTGDELNLALWLTLLGASAASALALSIKRK